MILHDYVLSASCYKIRLMAALLDVPLGLVAVDFHPGREHRSAAFRTLNPAGTLPVLVDGGIRRGTDVLKALALGAQAVLIGRPYVYALATAGALGVAHVLRLLQDELAIAMALCGCATVPDIHRGLLVRP